MDSSIQPSRLAQNTARASAPKKPNVQEQTPLGTLGMPSPSGSARNANVSTVFGPTRAIGTHLPDLVVISSDRVQFHTHRHHLSRASSNGFGGVLLQSSSPVTVPESSDVFNVVLHALHGMSCVQHHPTLETIEAALDSLLNYGINIKPLAAPSQPIYQLLLAQAPYRPIDAYALAGHHKLEVAAVAISAHLLAYDTSKLSDELTVKMGPVYFRRLLDLHQARVKALKNILMRPPGSHPPRSGCAGQLTQVWAFAVAQLAWDAMPGLSTHALQLAFDKAGSSVTCAECKAVLHARVQEVIQQWSAVKDDMIEAFFMDWTPSESAACVCAALWTLTA